MPLSIKGGEWGVYLLPEFFYWIFIVEWVSFFEYMCYFDTIGYPSNTPHSIPTYPGNS